MSVPMPRTSFVPVTRTFGTTIPSGEDVPMVLSFLYLAFARMVQPACLLYRPQNELAIIILRHEVV